MEFQYNLPVNLIFGRGKSGSIGEVAAKYGKKILVVTGTGSTKRSGLLDRTVLCLKKAGVESEVFDKVTQNPLTTTVLEGVELAKKNGCDAVLGVGGGSIMDAAKAIAFCCVNDGDVSDYIFGKKQGKGALPIILMPTTCGTGSEGNQISVLTNPDTKDKKALYTMRIMPSASIVDPEVMKTMPKQVLSSVGFDAFTHSLEAYTSKKSNPLTDAQALLGIKLITENLPELMSNYDDDDAWEKVSLAEAEGISLTSMRDSFSKIYGMPPIRYLTMVRLNASKKLLAETDQSIETIAQKCGFTGQFYFSRVFKRQCGVTPSEFRKIILMDI